MFAIVLYVWSCKRKPGIKKHSSNARVIPVVPIELCKKFLKNSNASQREMAFNCGSSPTELSSSMTRHNDSACALSTLTPCLQQSKEVVELSHLKSESVLALIISRAVHLKDHFLVYRQQAHNSRLQHLRVSIFKQKELN